MKVLTTLLMLPLFTGCAATVDETHGFDPATAAMIHQIFGGGGCTGGVASEERTLRAEVRNANRSPYYRPFYADQKELTTASTKQVIVCK